jgi:hypothetical protein
MARNCGHFEVSGGRGAYFKVLCQNLFGGKKTTEIWNKGSAVQDSNTNSSRHEIAVSYGPVHV